jgi:hypothetical protein
VYIFYVDESGNTGKHVDSTEPVHWLSAVAVRVASIHAVEADMLALARDGFGARAKEPGCEFHGSDLFSGRRECRGMEAEARVGGVMRSGRVQGHLLEWGPQRTRLTGPLQALVEELELSSSVVMAPAGLPLLVYAAGRLREVSFSLGGLLRDQANRDLAVRTQRSAQIVFDEFAGDVKRARVDGFHTRRRHR